MPGPTAATFVQRPFPFSTLQWQPDALEVERGEPALMQRRQLEDWSVHGNRFETRRGAGEVQSFNQINVGREKGGKRTEERNTMPDGIYDHCRRPDGLKSWLDSHASGNIAVDKDVAGHEAGVEGSSPAALAARKEHRKHLGRPVHGRRGLEEAGVCRVHSLNKKRFTWARSSGG
ncbi:hypothetical protein BJV78DRAFT_1153122 [Lactifluus subvellereus]|nr:hypothetical protein BJV78DRAFT_1153122 [Lactifluus subvellereus]